MEKLNWGILGAGIIAHKMADAIIIEGSSILSAVASKTPEKAEKFAEEFNIPYAYSYDDLMSDNTIDIVYIATTHNFHFENAKMCLEAGKHILIEKPFTVTAQEASDLITLARRKNLFLMEAMWTRFLPSIHALKQEVKCGRIGKVRNMTFAFGGFTPPKYAARLRDPNLAGGVTLDMGIYPISMACFLLDETPAEIKSMTEMSISGVDELSHYMFRFPSDCFANITTSFNLLMKNQAVIYGTKGYIVMDNFQAGESFEIFIHDGERKIQRSETKSATNAENGFVYQVAETNRCINAGKIESPIMPLVETLAIMKVMDAMRAEWGLTYP